ncbi:hypothetical protein [Haloarchaeobius sp. DFWS5]|uniref:hypothetical protein n=1 Tax=Haloarchaeobius sp. DFWS5 TaxID=3446114 RepID=UPI003EBDEB75
MSTIESYISTNFIYDDSPRSGFESMVDMFDGDDGVRCIQDTTNSASFYTESIRGEVRFRPSDEHPYSCSTDFVELTVLCDELASESSEEALEALLELVRSIYDRTAPQYVFGMHDWRIELIESLSVPRETRIVSPISDEGLAAGHIDLPTWLMLFTPSIVEEYGRSWLLDLPVTRNEELEDGSILVIVTEEIVDPEPVDQPWMDQALAEIVLESMKPLEPLFED